MAARLTAQEEQIELLTREFSLLRDGLNGGPEVASILASSPELESLRSENEKLKFRLVHLRRGLQEELALEGQGKRGTNKGQEKTGKQQPKNRNYDNNKAATHETKPVVDKEKPENIKKAAQGGVGGRELKPWPGYISERMQLYEELKKESDALLTRRAADSQPITVELPDGCRVEGQAWVTTPYQLACGISQGLADNAVISRVNGDLWDLDRPLEKSCSLEILRFDNDDAQAVYWHSSAHILGEAMERFYGGCLCYGPPIENGFYYDMGVSSTEFEYLEALCKSVVKEKQPFERLEVSKETLLKMFKYNKFKCRILNEKVTTPTTTVYRCGPLIDLCRGPHVRHTGKIKALKIYKNSSTYWEGRSDMETLQRIYGISFPDSKMLKDLMFSHRPRSWRELPLRLADFGVLHRNELSGTLTGLTRVRRFQQDDAHIFCTMEQIESEMKGCLDFLRCVYDVFGFSFQLHLSTRPEKYLGDIAVWNQAEKVKLNMRLFIELKDGDDKGKPVIIHRAILGSVERMIAILTENYAGKWPLWLSPRQVMFVPVNPTCEEYAKRMCKQFVEAGFMADADLDSSCLLNKKIRNAQLAQYNFILVVGEKEKLTNSVNVRTRDNKVHGELSVSEVLARLTLLKESRCRNAEEEF
uniref:threonine--tRNA ligase n=1 Tax=Oncorhynchus mykiss TaxID=8022 RepID=A0A8C7W2R5_ONCMY